MLIFVPFPVIHQRYDLEVQNPGGFIGSNVIIKCNIPQFVKEYVKVTSWLEEPMHNIYPSAEGGKLEFEKFESPQWEFSWGKMLARKNFCGKVNSKLESFPGNT